MRTLAWLATFAFLAEWPDPDSGTGGYTLDQIIDKWSDEDRKDATKMQRILACYHDLSS